MERIKIPVVITLESPLHLGAGGGDVNADAEVVHEACGLPYFPAKRFRGLLHESALETAEMAERCGAHFLTKDTVDCLFGHKAESDVELVISDFHLLPEGEEPGTCEQMKMSCRRLADELTAVEESTDITAHEVLLEYTSLRVQTSIDDRTGTTKDGSLRNMRCVNGGLRFAGLLEIAASEKDRKKYLGAAALALQNLRAAGGKRSRGFGRISCEMTEQDQKALVKEALAHHE